MKQTISRIMALVIGISLVLASGTIVPAQAEPVALTFDGERSHMAVTGTSTIHDWTCSEITLNGSVTLPGLTPDENSLPLDQLHQYLIDDTTDTPRARLAVPVKKMACEKSGMDSRMHNALKAEKHPRFRYEMTRVAVDRYDTEAGVLVLSTKGELEIGGTTNLITMPVRVQISEEGQLVIKGQKAMTMSQFNVERPSAMWGTIQAYDDITVKYTVYADLKPTEGEE